MRGAVVVVALTSLLAACAGPADDSSGRESVVVGFYPLQYAAERVGGDRVSVRNLAGGGVEPHDLELTPGDVGKLSNADLVISLPGFQPALDEALRQSGAPSFDASTVARLDRTYTPPAGEPGGGSGQPDPHFWLDPLRMADLADGVAGRLGTQDAAGKAGYEAAATRVRQEMAALDEEYRTGLRDCRSRAIVTSHYAFGYLAARYDLEQVSLSGLRPDSEPSPAELKSLEDYVRDHQITTIYAEVLANSNIDRTVADDTGATVAVLDPIEGLTTTSAAPDYPGLMRANLAALRTGLGCR